MYTVTAIYAMEVGGKIVKILITGATGLLGGYLIKELQKRGEQIRALILPLENADLLIQQGIETIRGI
ncbi:hypothetical protein KDK_23940 [Dictyobacter kobayashii]|uniref:NAD-dependent epimerase/dehydratase domain-containing protein n=1 Tax=Dictyobacter kobayashii TaxID=2014872 RepID=A0A402AHT1_9CHLR|nr:hypothetical protein KDK_23940 [Dictyobacter kobayashii]